MIENIVNGLSVASVGASSYIADMPPIDFSDWKKYALYSGVALIGLTLFVGYALARNAGKNRSDDE